MTELMAGLWESVTIGRVLFVLAGFVISLLVSALIVGIVIVKIPENYHTITYRDEQSV